MKKSKLSLNELIHEGATVCFDWLDYLEESPPDLTFGLEQEFWNQDEFKRIQKLHLEAVDYIQDNKINGDQFDFDFKEEYLQNNHYLTLSIFGNKIEEIFFSNMDDSDIEHKFEEEDFYYNLEDIRVALDYAIKKLGDGE